MLMYKLYNSHLQMVYYFEYMNEWSISAENASLFILSEGKPLTVNTNDYTKVIISRPSEGPNCSVCVGEDSSQACGAKQVIVVSQSTQVNFTCSRPQDIFTIEINREFGKWQQRGLLGGGISCFLNLGLLLVILVINSY